MMSMSLNMSDGIAWGIYLGMAVLLVFGYERYIACRILNRHWRIFLRALLVIGLFTPGVVTGGEVYIVPACVGVMFNLLAHSNEGMLQAVLPLLVVGTVVFAMIFVAEVVRKEKPVV
jgi:glucan phosphoethanolaminetransferase (alkaline phosphatase superfamily)